MLEVSVFFWYNFITFLFIQHAYNYIIPAVILSQLPYLHVVYLCTVTLKNLNESEKHLQTLPINSEWQTFKILLYKASITAMPFFTTLPLPRQTLFCDWLPLLPAITSYFSHPWFLTILFFYEVPYHRRHILIVTFAQHISKRDR